MSRRNIVVTALPTTDALVDLEHRHVDIDKSVHNSSAVNGRYGKLAIGNREMDRWRVRRQIQVQRMGELHANLVECLI